MRAAAAALVWLALVSGPAGAVEPDEMLDDPALEARARALSLDLRCVVCQNQDIDSSNAGVARTMRILLRERLEAGDSDDEVMDFFVQRYGNYVLFQPPMQTSTLLLWIGPGTIFLAGAAAIVFTMRRRGKARAAADLTADEERALARALDEDDAR